MKNFHGVSDGPNGGQIVDAQPTKADECQIIYQRKAVLLKYIRIIFLFTCV